MDEVEAPCPGNGLGVTAELGLPSPPAIVLQEEGDKNPMRLPLPVGSWSYESQPPVDVAATDVSCPGNGRDASGAAEKGRWSAIADSRENTPRDKPQLVHQLSTRLSTPSAAEGSAAASSVAEGVRCPEAQ